MVSFWKKTKEFEVFTSLLSSCFSVRTQLQKRRQEPRLGMLPHTHTHTPCNSTCQLWHINRRRICSTAWTVELETYNIDVDLCEDWRWQSKHTFAKGICGISRQPAIAYPVYLANIYVRIYIYSQSNRNQKCFVKFERTLMYFLAKNGNGHAGSTIFNYSISQAPWWQHISASTRKEVVVGEHPECEQQGFQTQKTKKWVPSTYQVPT